MRILLTVILAPLVLVAASQPGLGQQLTRQRAAAAPITALGGRFEVNQEALGRPVVAVTLTETAVSDQDLAMLAQLPDLERLHLQATRITDAGLAHLKHCTPPPVPRAGLGERRHRCRS